MIKAVIFDLYGTLMTSLGASQSKDEALSCILREAGHEVYYQELAAARQFVSFVDYPRGKADTPTEYYGKVLERLEITANTEIIENLARKDIELEEAILFPDVIPTLKALKTARIKTAIVTTIACWKFAPLLKRNKARIDFICTAREARAVKPNPKIYLTVLDEFHVRAEEAISIGDDPETDITPAKKLGMKTVLLCRQGKAECPDADHVVSSLTDLLDLLH